MTAWSHRQLLFQQEKWTTLSLQCHCKALHGHACTAAGAITVMHQRKVSYSSKHKATNDQNAKVKPSNISPQTSHFIL